MQKCLKTYIMTNYLRHLVNSEMDPLQFAHRPGIGVEDAVIYLLHRSISHLESTGSTVRVMFFFTSLVVSTQSNHHCSGRSWKVDCHLAAWTTDYLTNRPQYVRLCNCMSDVVVCSTGAPQGTMLSPFLFTLYTLDFSYNTDNCHLQKYSDNTAVITVVAEGNNLDYSKVFTNFVAWCELKTSASTSTRQRRW